MQASAIHQFLHIVPADAGNGAKPSWRRRPPANPAICKPSSLLDGAGADTAPGGLEDAEQEARSEDSLWLDLLSSIMFVLLVFEAR